MLQRENVTPDGGFGHNSGGVRIAVEVRLFNSLTRHGGGQVFHPLSLPAGSTVGDVIRRFGIPLSDVYLVLVNGRDVTPTLGGLINEHRILDEGDVLALSGPVPFSWAYGAPVV
ncbi:MAG TPA: MoaD/ThiS family protein [Azospirillum sp.]